MALLCSRFITRTFRNPIAAASRLYSDKVEIAQPSELATGLESFQLQKKMEGDEDPFRLRAIKRHPSSKSNPNLVPSYYDCRIVGCVCEEDSGRIVWMWLFKGEPRRCHCGHWFKLSEYKPT